MLERCHKPAHAAVVLGTGKEQYPVEGSALLDLVEEVHYRVETQNWL